MEDDFYEKIEKNKLQQKINFNTATKGTLPASKERRDLKFDGMTIIGKIHLVSDFEPFPTVGLEAISTSRNALLDQKKAIDAK